MNRIMPWLRSTLICSACLMLLGCFATTHRGPWTLAPGEISAGANYSLFQGDNSNEPERLVAAELRLGLPGHLDLGYTRTFDVSKDIEDLDPIDTDWLDVKLQVLNRSDVPGKRALSFGYGFGDLIRWSGDDALAVNSLYLSTGRKSGKYRTFYTFRLDHWDKKVRPLPDWLWRDEFSNLIKSHVLGFEVEVSPLFRPVIEVGRYYTDDFTDGVFAVALGINYYPARRLF